MVGGLVLLFLASVVLVAVLGTRPVGTNPSPGATNDPGIGDTATGGQGQDVDGIKCEAGERLEYHIHSHLYILVDGRPQTVSAQVGIPGYPLPRCIYWLHTHDASGVIHVESPVIATYTLGQFFDIWGQPLNRTDVATYPVTGGQLTVFVDGKEYTGDPRDIPLKAHTQIVIEIGQTGPPPQNTFPPGL
jgi:hypothetical protein